MASAQTLMSFLLARQSPQIVGPFTSVAIFSTASKSPGDATGKPASITSTPNLANWWATASFSFKFILQPGACSPSRKVVSKIITLSLISKSSLYKQKSPSISSRDEKRFFRGTTLLVITDHSYQ